MPENNCSNCTWWIRHSEESAQAQPQGTCAYASENITPYKPMYVSAEGFAQAVLVTSWDFICKQHEARG